MVRLTRGGALSKVTVPALMVDDACVCSSERVHVAHPLNRFAASVGGTHTCTWYRSTHPPSSLMFTRHTANTHHILVPWLCAHHLPLTDMVARSPTERWAVWTDRFLEGA